jgi:hypothetical protein
VSACQAPTAKLGRVVIGRGESENLGGPKKVIAPPMPGRAIIIQRVVICANVWGRQSC